MPEVDVRQGELAPARQPFERGDRLQADLRGALSATDEAIQAREGAQAVALGPAVVERPAVRESALLRGDRPVEVAGEVALIREALQQLGLVIARQGVGARAYWAAASRWAPSEAARAAATGAQRATVVASPAASA